MVVASVAAPGRTQPTQPKDPAEVDATSKRAGYTHSMACSELEKMRQEAHELFKLLREKRGKARVHARENKSLGRGVRSDFEPFLKNKISALSGKISQHLTQHQCE